MNSQKITSHISGVTQDSRQVRPGFLFAALRGSRQDGHAYIEDALRHGATYILVQRGASLPPAAKKAIIIESDCPERDLSLIAAEFYNHQPQTIVAITGTNGKTSSAVFVQQIWALLGFKAASLGTLGVRGSGVVKSGSMTTPDAVSLMAGLADLAAAGITHLAMEASSHGLKQYRLDGVHVQAAGFTNLTRDHLDYHPDMEDYFAAKARLVCEVLVPGGIAVLNADIPEFSSLKEKVQRSGRKILSYGRGGEGIKLLSCMSAPGGQEIGLEIEGQTYHVLIPLVGSFMVMNALCALGLVLACGAGIEDSVSALAQLEGAPGRLQSVPGHPNGAAIYVDYAHTPDALENILKALRPHTNGRLICVFGCGGDRDPGKRPLMGQCVARLADIGIVTDDNPRSENPASIRAAILKDLNRDVMREQDDRRRAIESAVAMLQTGDVLVIAGKGHEQGQIFSDHTAPFDDVEEAVRAITLLKENGLKS